MRGACGHAQQPPGPGAGPRFAATPPRGRQSAPGVREMVDRKFTDSCPVEDSNRDPEIEQAGGGLALLGEAIRLARIDWRDLLVAAGFGEDPAAHLRWRPEKATGDEE